MPLNEAWKCVLYKFELYFLVTASCSPSNSKLTNVHFFQVAFWTFQENSSDLSFILTEFGHLMSQFFLGQLGDWELSLVITKHTGQGAIQQSLTPEKMNNINFENVLK